MMMSESKLVILVVDDDGDFAEMMRTFFALRGYEVHVARAYPKAERLVKQIKGKFIAFVDIHLPGDKDGYDVLALIKKIARHRSIAYSWTTDKTISSRVKAIKAGALHVFAKTEFNEIDWDDLLTHLEADVSARLEEMSEDAKDEKTKLLLPEIFDAIAESELEASWGEASIQKGKPERVSWHPDVFSLATMDIDYFKEVNDSHGHETGNRAIEAVAKVIREHVRPSDHPCRSGGDEFMVLFPSLDVEGATSRCSSIQKSISEIELLDFEGRPVVLSTSFGVAEVRRDQIGPDAKAALELLKVRSDQKLYEAKAARPGGLTKRD